MRGPTLLITLCLIAAGCTDTPVAASEPDGPAVEVTDDTGAIRGIVVDDAFRPLFDVQIALQTGESTATDIDGAFTFSGLEPGTYFVEAAHPSYAATQQSVDVVAGDRSPPVMKIQLAHLGEKAPYQQTLYYVGYIVCSLGISLIYSEECGEGVGLPDGGRIGKNEDNHIRFDFQVDGPHVQTIIVEQVWTPATDAAQQLLTMLNTDWACTPGCGGNRLGSDKGESPLHFRVEGDPLADAAADPENIYSTYSLADNDVAEVNVALDQEFELFVSLFYNTPAPEGWSFVR